jgi:hypothetical protein
MLQMKNGKSIGSTRMKPSKQIECHDFPCGSIYRPSFIVPSISIDPTKIAIAMISECAPANPLDYYYAKGEPLFAQTTIQAFQDAGEQVSSVDDLIGIGVYLTTAIKCAKDGPVVSKKMIGNCSYLLEKELALFPNLKVIMLMGDAAIQAINEIARRNTNKRAIPAEATYKIRKANHEYRGIRLFPAYLQAGPSFYIEKSKRKMIAEDIARALKYIRQPESEKRAT